MALELSQDAADQVFGADISEVVDAERHLEPDLVLAIVDKHQYAPDFQGKADLVGDLTGRTTRQQDNFKARAAAYTLDNKIEAGVQAGADALCKLDQRARRTGFERGDRPIPMGWGCSLKQAHAIPNGVLGFVHAELGETHKGCAPAAGEGTPISMGSHRDGGMELLHAQRASDI